MKLRPCSARSCISRGTNDGFTLIELLVAASIAALMMMTAIPYAKDVRKTPLVKAVNSLVEGCRQARLKAILKGQPMQLVIYDNGGAIGVEPVPVGLGTLGWVTELKSEDVVEGGQAKPASGGVFDARISDEIAFRLLRVNGYDRMQDSAVTVKFYPNGTSDALEAELQWLKRDVRRVVVDVMTGVPIVEAAP